ncbi:uncharacterized protein L969DRAFT_84431 [Mixia osmundae IAM 14324]|uniref:Phosphatidyl-N-methylethanolamine N-methyltransferase n=1 Tax=Mixia osmundae (strain CBS 9802 / IAM 14324 / JCM 22182 / KY 12970) TaxID=764103 RepID=G7E2X0_MIXOS|nr:uncharacterized protein L969DRAFT_84431 [Mixia osmundae IAM 14324]KEI42562.1 hypothetical protein L969DRAFT_84431 [Mixia osmundae IAM 14324]GAA97151.1 hypothetical protein E5Q_03826 [Mixia osmundae IAM 14324]
MDKLDLADLPPRVVRAAAKLGHFGQARTDKYLVDFHQPSLYIALASILFNPIFWNIIARQEYKNKVLTRLFGDPYRGCYALALTIFGLGLFRDGLYQKALLDQPTSLLLAYGEFKIIAVLLMLSGTVLVLTSMYALGVTGTYLGDYFGILMDAPVTGFPFSVTSSPMYTGSSLVFLGTALWHESPVGIVLSAIVYIEYKVALTYEDPFTSEIYAKRDAAPRRSQRLLTS